MCPVVILATLTGLDDHIGQLLHLKVKINSEVKHLMNVLLSDQRFHLRVEVTRLWDKYLVLPAHVVEDWQRLQRLGNAAGLGRGSRVVMLIQGQNL